MQASRSSKYGALRTLFSAPRVWLVLVLWLAWALRLYHLGSMSIWWDESLSWDRATSPLVNILSNTIYIQNVATRDLHPPLYFLLLHFAILAAGATEFALRFLSAYANLLTLAMLYPLTRLLCKNKLVAWLTVLFAALAPFYVWYSQEARPYALVLLWSTLAVYALLRWLKTNPSSGRAWFSRWFMIFAVALILTLVTHYLSFVLLPFFAATMFIFGDRVRAWRARMFSPVTLTAAAMLAAFGTILFLLPRSVQDLASWDQAGASFVPFFIMLRDVWNSFAVGLTANLDQVALLDLLLVALWLVGMFSTLRVKRREVRLALFLFCYLFLPAIMLQLGSYLRPLYLNSRHLITTSPAYYLGLAIGVDALARRCARVTRASRVPDHRAVVAYAFAFAAVAGVFVAGASFSLYNLYYDAAYAKDDHKAWAEFLRERLRPDDYLLLVAPQAEKIVQYYAPPNLQWESLPHLGQTQDWQMFLDRESVLNAYRHHGRVWFLEIHQPVGDPKHAINNLMYRYGEPVDIVYFPGISTRIILQQFVYRGVEQPKDAKLPNPVEITYDDNLQLLGYDAPRQMEPGTRAAVKLYWRLNHKTPNDVSVSLRVTDANGQIWGQWDAPPVGNLYPVSKWVRKTIYLDQHDLVVDPGTPPGTYTIEMTVYRAAGHEALAAKRADASDELASVSLGELQVTRPPQPMDPRTLIMDQHTDIPFGSAVRFVGFDQEQTASPGNAVPLTLYFQGMQNLDTTMTGQVELTAPWWQLWNRTRAVTPFTLDLHHRQAGDIAQVNLGAHVPGDADAGTYTLRLSLDGLGPQTILPSGNDLAFAEVQVQALARSTEMPAISQPLNARLSDSIEFLGYDLNAPQPLKPGDPIKLKLYWRALKPVDTSYKVFTHLINSQNEIFGQEDQEPLSGARPTTSWAPGEIFSDAYEFSVAHNAGAGTYHIEIGMYDPTNLKRLPTFDANGSPTGDRIVFGELRIP
jgi:mannosyltransferase